MPGPDFDMPVFRHKVILYVSIDADTKDALRELAEANDRTISSVASIVLRKGLGLPAKHSLKKP
jgi:hypothetical protein